MRTPLAALALAATLATPALARDPFAPFEDDVIHCFGESPLQQVPIGALKVQGIVANTASPRALLVLPDGTAYLVRVGDPVGRNLGVVAAIRPNGVVVVEEFRDAITGKRIPQRTVLAVR